MELNDYIIDLLTDFDEMGFAPTTMCPNPEAYAIEWRNKITKAFKELTEENERLRAERESVNKEAFRKWKKIADETADRFEGLYQDAKKALVADTVRKMQSEIERRCIKGGIYPAFVASTIKQITKEMLEGI